VGAPRDRVRRCRRADARQLQGPGQHGRVWREFLSTWEDYRVEAEDYRELEGDRVLVFIRIRGRGKTSGLEVGRMGAKGANLFHLRNGKVARLVLYFDRGRALADLGLTPGGGSPYES
jgi:hypothetical protein